MQVANKAPYNSAYQTALQFEELYDCEKRLQFWDAHHKVFGDASVLVFDTQNEVYFDWSGHPYGFVDLNPEERYKAFWIWPNDATEFSRFMIWCIPKYRFWNHFDIMDEAYYWKQIKNKSFAEEFLSGLLSAAEELRNQNPTLPSPFGNHDIGDELAKDYFFFYGNQDAWEGNQGALPTDSCLFSIFTKMHTRQLSEYGGIFSRYYHGYHTAKMVKFLREQKKRLDRGETENDIKTPNTSINNRSETTPTSPPPPTELPPLHLVLEARQDLYEALNKFVEEASRPALHALIIDGIKPATQIVVTCPLNRFGLSFHNAKAVPEKGGTQLSKQLPDYFLRNDGRAIVTLKPSILVKALLGGEIEREQKRKKRNNP